MRDTLQEDHSLKSYTIPFSNKLWLCIFTWVIILSVAHVAIRLFINNFMTREGLKECHMPLHTPVFSLFNQCKY